MPQKRLTVQDDTGRKVTFDWHGDENPTDSDLTEIFAAAKAGDQKKNDDSMNLSRVLGRASGKDFKLPAQQYNAPAPPKAPSRRGTIAGMGDLLDEAARSKGLERTDAERQASSRMAEGASSGGLSTSTPVALGVKAAEFAPALSSAVKSGAERMYGGLLKAKDATITNFPTVVQDLIAAGAPIARSGRQKMINLMKQAGATKNALLDAADQRAMIPREAVREGLDVSLDRAMAQSPRPVKDLGTLAKIEKELIPDNPGILPSHGDRIKTTLYGEAKSGLAGRKLGNKVTDTVANAKMDVANKLKGALEYIEPQLEGVNQAYSTAKGGAQALRDAVKRTSKHNVISLTDVLGALLGTATGGPGLGTAAGVGAVRAMNNPNIGSRIAIGMDRISKLPLDQTAKMALLALLNQVNPQQQNQQEPPQ